MLRPGRYYLWPLTRYRNRVAVIFEDRRLTFGEMDALINRLSHGLLGLGLATGHKVAILSGNSVEAAVAIFAIPRAGLTYVTLNARHSPQEHLDVLNDAGVDALLIAGEYLPSVEPVLEQARSLKHVVVIAPSGSSHLSYEELTAGRPTTPPDVEVDPHRDIERIHYTSGTTGRPKGAVWPFSMNEQVLNSILINLDRPIGPEDINLNIGPLTHAAGLMMMVYYARGATNIILPRFDEEAVLRTIERERVTSVLFIPTMLYRLLMRSDLESYDLSSIRRIWYGTAPMAVDRLRQAIDVFGNVFRQNYGMTEIPQPITFLGPEDHIAEGDERRTRRLQSAGRPAMGVEIRILDEEDREVGPGEVGEIVLRADKLILGYWNMPEATAEAFKDGWFYTHDMGMWDEDGFLYIMDRKNDMIITGGFNVYPREVEEIVMRLPEVAEAVVIGVPDDLWGESIKAFVVTKEGCRLTGEDVLEHCRKHLSGYKKPKTVEFISRVPKNLYGKVDRRALKEPYWKGKARRVH